MKVVAWLLVIWLLHLVGQDLQLQTGIECPPTEAPHRCIRCNQAPIMGHSTCRLLVVILHCTNGTLQQALVCRTEGLTDVLYN